MEGELYKAIQWLYLGWIYDIYHIHIIYIYHTRIVRENFGLFRGTGGGLMGYIMI